MNRLLTTQRERKRERGRELSVQLAFCSVGSNKSCLPGSPLRQEQLPRDPTEPPTSQTSDRGAVWKLYRDLITHCMAKHCSDTRWQASHTLFFIKRKLSHSTLPQLYYIPLWWRHILDGQKPRRLKAGLLSKYKLSIHGTLAGGKT